MEMTLDDQELLKLSNIGAKSFFLTPEQYCNVDLPGYFNFQPILKISYDALSESDLNNISVRPSDVRSCDGINHKVISNKHGSFTWRPFSLINPLMYVDLVNAITKDEHWGLLQERFAEFQSNSKIECVSIPLRKGLLSSSKAENISNWVSKVEQRSIELALEFSYLFETDIGDCYGSIYTHSIAWAVHGKNEAKSNRRDRSLLGNMIDNSIQSMQLGQTNGIPQGSTLMDFVAEIVLGYADSLLTQEIGHTAMLQDYKIIRYRDDYRIFVNNSQDGETILRLLSNVLIDLGLKLNPSKTKYSSDILTASIKEDKREWAKKGLVKGSFQNKLLNIYEHANQYPNSGSVSKGLDQFYRKLLKIEELKEPVEPLVSIVVNIAYKNPRIYPLMSAILSKLFCFFSLDEEKTEMVEKIKAKFDTIPNSSLMEIWLQRATWTINQTIEYKERLCDLAELKRSCEGVWSFGWVSSISVKRDFSRIGIIDSDKLENLIDVVELEEIELFKGYEG